MATKKCNEWPLIEDKDILQEMISRTIPTWKMEEGESINKLVKTCTLKNFQSALNFINKVGAVAEERGHHPDLHLTGYRNVSIVVYSFSLKGLTQNDFDLAEAIDQIPTSTGPPKST